MRRARKPARVSARSLSPQSMSRRSERVPGCRKVPLRAQLGWPREHCSTESMGAGSITGPAQVLLAMIAKKPSLVSELLR